MTASMIAGPGPFTASVRSRLLPMSVPFRYFGAGALAFAGFFAGVLLRLRQARAAAPA